MSESVIAYIVSGLIFVSDDFRILAGGFANDKERGRNVFLFQDFQDLRGPGVIGAVVKGEGELGFGSAHLLDTPGKRIGLVRLIVDHVAAGIVIDGAAAALRGGGDAPNIAITFENQIVAGRNFIELGANGVVRMGGIPD